MKNVPIQVDDISNNMSYNYTHTLSYVIHDDVDVDTICGKIYKDWVTRSESNARNIDYL